jgi:hypothetical protein
LIGITRGTLAKAALISKTSPFYFNFAFFSHLPRLVILSTGAPCTSPPNFITSTLSRVGRLEIKVVITLPVEDHRAAFAIAFAIVRRIQRGIRVAANDGG